MYYSCDQHCLVEISLYDLCCNWKKFVTTETIFAFYIFWCYFIQSVGWEYVLDANNIVYKTIMSSVSHFELIKTMIISASFPQRIYCFNNSKYYQFWPALIFWKCKDDSNANIYKIQKKKITNEVIPGSFLNKIYLSFFDLKLFTCYQNKDKCAWRLLKESLLDIYIGYEVNKSQMLYMKTYP